MAMFDEIRRAGLLKPFIGMFIGALLLVSWYPGNEVGLMASFLWILLMMVSTAVYLRRFSTTTSVAVLLVPMIAGYVVLVQTTVIAAAGDRTLLSQFSPFALVGIVMTWCSFCWLLMALEKERSGVKLKNDAKLKNDEKVKHDDEA